MFHKVLVTGAAGFIGKHVVKHYLDMGCEVVGIDNLNDFTYSAVIKYDRLESVGLDTRLLKLGGTYAENGNFTFHVVDVADGPTVIAMIIDGGFDLIVHLSGMTSVSASSLSPTVFFKQNVDGFINVLEGVKALDPASRPKLLWASSAAAYGTSEHVAHFNEDDRNQLNPASIYGASKCMMENAAEVYARLYDVRSVAMRFFNIFGPFERPDTFISNVAYDIIHDETLTYFGDGRASHDFMYIDDCVDAVARIADVWLPERQRYDVVNVGTQEPYSCLELVAMFEEVSGKKMSLASDPDVPAGETNDLSADVSKFRRLYGIAPKVGIREGIARVYAWYREYYRV